MAIIVLLLITNAVTLGLYLNEKYAVNEEDYFAECQAEIDDFKLFICDWYAELSEKNGEAEIYKNEIRFKGGKYPLTVSANRIRAVFPRGERFFRLKNITHAEFSNENGRTLCRIYYGNGGEFVFRID